LRPGAGGAEGGDVHRGGPYEWFDLALAGDRGAAAAFDRGQSGVVGAAGGFQNGQPAQPQAVPANWQPQRRVGRVTVGPVRGAQGAPGDGHRPEHGRQLTPVPALQAGAALGERSAARSVKGRQPGFFEAGAQVEVALQQQTGHLPRPAFGDLFHLLVRQAKRISTGEVLDERSEAGNGSVKGVSRRSGVIRSVHRALDPGVRTGWHRRR
jgi:hypothetical protein